MRILYIHALYPPYVAGGAEISLKLLVEAMQARGHEVAVLSLVPEGELTSGHMDGVKVYRVGLENIYWPFSDGRPGILSRLRWHLRDRYNRTMMGYVEEVLNIERPDIVSCHNLVGWSVAVWDAVRRTGIPVVQVLHDMYLLSPDSTLYKPGYTRPYRGMISRLLRRHHRKASAGVNAVVGISRSILDRFTGYGYFKQVPGFVVHNVRAIPDSGPPRHRVTGDRLTVGFIGTLAAPKGLEWLITQFKASGVEGRLRIAGSGKVEDEQYFRQLAGDDPRIAFIGHVPPSDFFPTIDVLAVPSVWEEPLGMVAVEGLANHMPVVASKRGGLTETVVDGVNGFLCDPDTPASLGLALARLWKDVDEYNRLADAARASVSDYLSVPRMAEAYERVYLSVLTNEEGTESYRA